jgi:hypothetical protein
MIHLILLVVLVWVVVRAVTAPFRFRRRSWYAYNPYAYGCRRRRGWVGGVLPILALVALDRVLGGRRF